MIRSKEKFNSQTILIHLVIASVAVTSFVISQRVLGRYGWGTFVVLPFLIGLVSTLTTSMGRGYQVKNILLRALFSLILSGFLVFALGLEGGLGLIMALPLGLFCAAIGAVIALFSRPLQTRWVTPCALLFVCPAVMGFDAIGKRVAPTLIARSAIEILGTPQAV